MTAQKATKQTTKQAPRQTFLEREPTHRPWLAFVLCAGVGVALAIALIDIPREAAHLPTIAREALTSALPRWHLTEPVNEIVYGSRAFDTFGETFILLAAVMSVVVLTRRRERRRGFVGEERAAAEEQREFDPRAEPDASEAEARNAEDREQGEVRQPSTPDNVPLGTPAPETAAAMTVVARTAMRFVAPVLAVAGLYLVAWGYAPGGGFPGGAVILGVVLLLYAGFGYRRIERAVEPDRVELLELAGAALIIFVELLGLVLKGSFTANWVPLAPPQTIRSGGVAQLFSASELIEVGTGLSLVFFALMLMRHDWTPDEEREPAKKRTTKKGDREPKTARQR